MSICLFIENILYRLFSDYGSPNSCQLILIVVIFVILFYLSYAKFIF